MNGEHDFWFVLNLAAAIYVVGRWWIWWMDDESNTRKKP